MTEDLFNKANEYIEHHGIINGLSYLSKAIGQAPGYPGIQDRIRQLAEEYRHALTYFQSGAKDENRKRFFDDYMAHAKHICTEAQMLSMYVNNQAFKAAVRKTAHFIVDEDVKEQLANRKGDALATAEYYSNLFYALLISPPWDRKKSQYYIGLLLDEDTSYIVGKVILSGVMLSCIEVYDYNKLYFLIQVYLSSANEQIRQFALLGWIFCYDKRRVGRTSEFRQLVKSICNEGKYVDELLILQKNLACLYAADEQSKVIDKEVFSKLLNNFRSTGLKLKEFLENRKEQVTEEDVLEFIEEGKMEEISNNAQESIEDLQRMERMGADIHYGSFSKMKDYGFFHTLANWFVPFYKGNPIFKALYAELEDTFLEAIDKSSAFCDSDKYSFCFSLGTIFKSSQKSMFKAMLTPESLGGIQSPDIDTQASAFISRQHVKDLIRFYNLSPMRYSFSNPFVRNNRESTFFLADDELFAGEMMDKARLDFSIFLAKRKMFGEMKRFVDRKMPACKERHLLRATLALKEKSLDACGLAAEALMPYQDDKAVALVILKCLRHADKYTEGMELCAKYMKAFPEEERFVDQMAFFCIVCRRYEDARPLLAKLEYLHPDRISYVRSLIWVYINLGELDKARKMFERIGTHGFREKIVAEDIYNMGVLCWLEQDVSKAIEAFCRYFKKVSPQGDLDPTMEMLRKFEEDKTLFEVFGEAKEANLAMMLDCIVEKLNHWEK